MTFLVTFALNPWFLIPGVCILGYLKYLSLEADVPPPLWVEPSFITVALISVLIYVYSLVPRRGTTLLARLLEGGRLIGALLLLQSLIAYYPYLHRECTSWRKLVNWAFGQGTYTCPPLKRHHISLKYLLECMGDILGSIISLLLLPFVVFYQSLFGSGWLNPFSWFYWILQGLTLCLYLSGLMNVSGLQRLYELGKPMLTKWFL